MRKQFLKPTVSKVKLLVDTKVCPECVNARSVTCKVYFSISHSFEADSCVVSASWKWLKHAERYCTKSGKVHSFWWTYTRCTHVQCWNGNSSNVYVEGCPHRKLQQGQNTVPFGSNCFQSINIYVYCFTSLLHIEAISREKKGRSREYALPLFRKVLYSAQYHRQHCTFHVFGQFGALEIETYVKIRVSKPVYHKYIMHHINLSAMLDRTLVHL